jgi:hypothetical protein
LEYADAREKFRAAVAKTKGATLYTLPIVDDSLTTDVAILPGTRPGVIFHSSGTHGVEGYAGSAIQLALLDESNNSVLPIDRPTIVFIHAINPYGMKHYRRFNENSVDLNRNGIVPDLQAFIKERDPNVAGYEDLRDLLSPARAPTWWDATFGYWSTSIPALMKMGMTVLKKGMVAGQYHHPEGIFFGGTEWQPSLTKLADFLQSQQQQHFEQHETTTKVWIDVHTGLGASGMDSLFVAAPSPPLSTLQDSFPTAKSIITSDVKDKKAMSGYDLTKGMITVFFQFHLKQHTKNNGSVFLTQEFGTLPGVLVGRALILENMMHHHGAHNNKYHWGRQWLQAAFYPQSTLWRRRVVQRGVAAMVQAIDYVNQQEEQKRQEREETVESSEPQTVE